MSIKNALLAAAMLSLSCAGCTTQPLADIPTGPDAYTTIPVKVTNVTLGSIAPGDRLLIKVLGEPDLTSDQYLVDENGTVEMPLIGDIKAAGRTVESVRDEIARRLGKRFVRDPQVVVSMAQHHKQVFTVEGQVREPGRYESASDMTLMGAIATAKGTTINAKLNEIIVLRETNGQFLAARFNIDEIRMGRVPDPQIVSGDKIVVGYSATKGAWHEFLQAAPLFNIFYAVKP